MLDGLLASIDVLAHPTRCDSGPPFVILEALQRGIPVVASDLPWIDEDLTGCAALRVPREAARVGEALIELFEPDTCIEASTAAVDLWRARYSMEGVAELVGSPDRATLAAGPR